MWGVKYACAGVSMATVSETVEGEVRWVIQGGKTSDEGDRNLTRVIISGYIISEQS